MSVERIKPEDDPFHPPDIPTEVHCLHCGEEYETYMMEWREEPGDGQLAGRWCCPTPGCDGAGFGFDIFPTDPEWRDPHGEMLISYDDDDDEDEDNADDGDDEPLDMLVLGAGDDGEAEDDEDDEDGVPMNQEEIDQLELDIEVEFVDDPFAPESAEPGGEAQSVDDDKEDDIPW